SLSMNDVGLALHGADVGAGPHAEARPWPLARVLFVQGANPVATAMNQGEFISGLERDDLFTVVHDQVLTDTALYADVVLPATTHFEAADLMASYGSFSLQRINPVIARVGESRSNDEVASAIAAALGLTGSEFDPDPERMAAIVLTSGMNGSSASVRPVGTTVQFVDTYPSFTGSTGSTASGRARLHDPASELPLPFYVAPGREGLTLLTPSSNRTINSMFAEFDPPEAAVSVHPVDAAARGIEDGDVVRAFNDLGEIRLLARVDGRVRPGVVSIPKGFWRRQFDNGHTANVLIPRGVNDLASGACFNDARIEIERCIR
ncbi:MAG: molybdopterin dinucleotide binding domain-containing protein, partial [Ilumatobacteraceae bacterium]